MQSFTSAPPAKKTFIDEQIDELKGCQNEILNYLNIRKDKFTTIGKIGLDSQEKLKLIGPLNLKFQLRSLEIADNKDIQTIEKVLKNYKQYNDNIKVFEQFENLTQTNQKYCLSPELKQLIKEGKKHIYQNKEVFEVYEPLNKQYQQTKEKIEKDLEAMPPLNKEFSEKLHYINNANSGAIITLLITDYSGMKKFLQDSDAIIKSYTDKKVAYDFIKRLEHMNLAAENLKKTIENPDKTDTEINKYLNEYNDYFKTVATNEEIKTYFNTLLKQVDETISIPGKELLKYHQNNPITTDSSAEQETLEQQSAILEEITNQLIDTQSKYYEKLNSSSEEA